METARAEIARERRRMVQVRQAFAAGLDGRIAGHDRSPAGFYLACADYLGFSMGRLFTQDQFIHDLLAERIPAGDVEAHRQLAVLNEQQRQGREQLSALGRAADFLRQAGGGALPAFESAAREFTASFNSSMPAKRNPFFRYTDELFTDADWVRIAGTTPASVAEEERLFAAVRDLAPAGVDPERFTARHGPG